MQRLYRKAFLIVWLTVTASIILMFTTVYLVRIFPFQEEVERGRLYFALDSAVYLLEKNGPTAAQQFAEAASANRVAVKLLVQAIGPAIDCAETAANTDSQRMVSSGSSCYRVVVERNEIGLLSRLVPRLAPWMSAFLAAAGAALWIARYLTRPVELLKEGLRSLAQGRFDVRIGDKINRKRDEVAALAHDFDLTAARLEEFQEVQRRLFHDVSHELRSPLSRLQAAVGVLRLNPARLEAMMERVEREIARMDNLVGEILTLARLTAGRQQPLERQTVDLIELVRSIVDDSIFESAQKNLTVQYRGIERLVATVNGELFYRAVENVVRNAVKHAPDGTEVIITAGKDSNRFLLTVEDCGPGVPQDLLDAIFQPFTRGSGSTSEGGFGLGLSITKHAFERHGGEVVAQRRRQGGLMIRMSLPLWVDFA
ncbi:HAMP domain-containing sensor histidine kinase [Rhizobium mongolense]